jgi:ribosomal protein L11 methyltransferase
MANASQLIELSVVVDSEAAEAVSELFNRYNGGGYDEDNKAGEAGGGGAVIEGTLFDDDRLDDPLAGIEDPLKLAQRLVVKTYLKPGARGEEIRRLIEDGLWRLSLLYPIPEAQIKVVNEEDWTTAWKQFYKPLRVGRNVVLKPSWEAFEAGPNDIIIELDPGLAFGTGLHPSTRLCVVALEELIEPGDSLLDVGTGSGVLSIVAAKLGAGPIFATDIDSLAVRVAQENAQRNQIAMGPKHGFVLRHESVPAEMAGQVQVIVANILAEILVRLFDGEYDNVPLAEPLAQGGVMILAGILEEKSDMVIEAARRHGLTYVDRKQEGDWVALIVRRDDS